MFTFTTRYNGMPHVSVGAFGFRLTIYVRPISLPRILLHVLGLALRKGVAWMKLAP